MGRHGRYTLLRRRSSLLAPLVVRPQYIVLSRRVAVGVGTTTSVLR